MRLMYGSLDQVVLYASLPLKQGVLFNELYKITLYFSKTVASYSTMRHTYEKKKTKAIKPFIDSP